MQLPLIESFGISDIGTTRGNNEDVLAELIDDHFYVVADGMGGHRAGEVAAKEAVLHISDSVERFLRTSVDPSSKDVARHFRKAFLDANTWIRSLTLEHPHFMGMGTTLCCCLFLKNEVIYAHIGDTRFYRYRTHLERLTHDHTVGEELLAAGEISEQKATKYKNALTRALGISPTAQPEIQYSHYETGDLYLITTDGLHASLSDRQIEAILKKSSNLKDTALELVEAAKNAGSTDNITVLIIRL